MLHVIGNQESIFNHFIQEIRDELIQKDPMRFRRNLERMGEIFAYEISKTMSYKMQDVKTCLGEANVSILDEQPVIATILRAGLPLHQGLMNYFDRSSSAFISAYRKTSEDYSFDIRVEYLSSPSIEGKVLILSDPMLATGSSLVKSLEALQSYGKPVHTHIVSVLASQQGVDMVQEALGSENVTYWMGAIDSKLNSKSYIVPGLGDAGDLAFGAKI
ncbi:MAG: uracil phosphoribosyltransferase [Hyphomicrobiales bacterium]